MLGKPHPEQDRVGGRSGHLGRVRVVRPFPRVGRSIPRATGGPDEWLLPPPSERGNRIRLTDLLRRIQFLPGARAVLARLRLAALLRCPRTPSLARGKAARGSNASGGARAVPLRAAAVQHPRGSRRAPPDPRRPLQRRPPASTSLWWPAPWSRAAVSRSLAPPLRSAEQAP